MLAPPHYAQLAASPLQALHALVLSLYLPSSRYSAQPTSPLFALYYPLARPDQPYCMEENIIRGTLGRCSHLADTSKRFDNLPDLNSTMYPTFFSDGDTASVYEDQFNNWTADSACTRTPVTSCDPIANRSALCEMWDFFAGKKMSTVEVPKTPTAATSPPYDWAVFETGPGTKKVQGASREEESEGGRQCGDDSGCTHR